MRYYFKDYLLDFDGNKSDIELFYTDMELIEDGKYYKGYTPAKETDELLEIFTTDNCIEYGICCSTNTQFDSSSKYYVMELIEYEEFIIGQIQ